MKVLNPRLDLDWFFRRLPESGPCALMLDYDGTLAPFSLERDRAVPYPGVGERLNRLIKLHNTRLVIVSGRWSRDLKPLLGLKTFPEIYGCHGAERVYPDGREVITPVGEKVVAGLVAIDDWARRRGLTAYMERKPTSVAFHWRGRSGAEVAAMRKSILARWSHEVETHSLKIHEFDGGLEIRAEGISKAGAVRDVLAELPSGAPVAYLGDDLTDEDAFRALPENALKVLVRKELRPTAADLWLVPPHELLAFLDNWIESRLVLS